MGVNRKFSRSRICNIEILAFLTFSNNSELLQQAELEKIEIIEFLVTAAKKVNKIGQQNNIYSVLQENFKL